MDPHVLLEKNINILALEMASPGNRHCADGIGALSFPIGRARQRHDLIGCGETRTVSAQCPVNSVLDSLLKRSRVRVPAVPLSGKSLEQVVHTHVPLCYWYRSQ